MLFKPRHIELIREGEKTETRREWSEDYHPPRIGKVVIAQYARDDLEGSPIFMSDDEADCYIRILDIYQQALGMMSDVNAQREGDYQDVDDFREGYESVYGDGAWDPAKVVHVVRFEYVGRERPYPQASLEQWGGR